MTEMHEDGRPEWSGAQKQGPHLIEFTQADKLNAIKREIAMRRSVYPRWVNSGKMKQSDADYQIAIMEQIAKDYGGTG